MRQYLLSLLFICLFCWACSTETDDVLVEAERTIHQSPDSSLHLLQGLSSQSFTDAEHRARYALLRTMAEHKSYIDVTSDSLISIASDFYGSHGPQYYRMLAHYYHAYICFNMKHLSHSSLLCLKAEEDAIELNDHFYLGQVYWLLGDVSYKSHNRNQYPHYAEKALKAFEKYGKERYIKDANLNIAAAYNAVFEYQKSLDKCLGELRKAEENKDTTYIVKSLQYLYMAQIGLREYNDAKETLLKLLDFDRYYPSFRSKEYANLAMLYSYDKNKIDSAQYYLSLVNLPSNPDLQMKYNYTLLKICEAKKDYGTYVDYSWKLFDQEDHLFIDMTQNEVAEAMKEYYYLNARYEEEQRLEERCVFILVSVILILVLGFLSLLFKLHKSRLTEKFLRAEAVAATLHEQLETYKSFHDKQHEEMKKLLDVSHQNLAAQKLQVVTIFRQRYDKINKILSYYAEDPKSPRHQKELIHELDKLIVSFHSPKDMAEMEECANLYLDGIMRRLREHMTTFQERDFILLLFLLVGFTPKTISLFVDESVKNIYSRKYRLKEKIEKSAMTDKKEIIDLIFSNV